MVTNVHPHVRTCMYAKLISLYYNREIGKFMIGFAIAMHVKSVDRYGQWI